MIRKGEIPMDTDDIEVQLFIDGMHMKYGYDFRDYSRAHMKRRIMIRLGLSNFNTVSEMQHEMLTNKDFFVKLVTAIIKLI